MKHIICHKHRRPFLDRSGVPLRMMVLLSLAKGDRLDLIVSSIVTAMGTLHGVRLWHLLDLVISKWHYFVILQDTLHTLINVIRLLHALDCA